MRWSIVLFISVLNFQCSDCGLLNSYWKNLYWSVQVSFLLTNMLTLFQLRESFKDLKKKFNNLKFNYTKKTEKARNLKVLKVQIQQVDTYAEKIQVILEILILMKASLVELLWSLPSRSGDVKCFVSFPVTQLYILPLSQSVTETFFIVLFLLFFHFLQWNDFISVPDFSVFTLYPTLFLFNLLFFLPPYSFSILVT